MNLEKTVNILAIALLLALGAVALIVMQKTAESNAITTASVNKGSSKNTEVLQEVREMGTEIEKLQRDMKEIREAVKKEKRRRKKMLKKNKNMNNP